MGKKRVTVIANVEKNHDIIKGIRDSIEKRLLVSHSPSYVNEIMGKVDLIIEFSTEMGIEIRKLGFDERVKINLYKARGKRKDG